MYSISIKRMQAIIFEHDLLREVIVGEKWLFQMDQVDELNKTFKHISYNSKDADESTLFFCKGVSFKQSYLEEAVKRGVKYYISEEVFDVPGAIGIIVSDIRKVMPLIAREFYGFPDEKLKMVGITGTKGKTTTTYFTHSILEKYKPGKTAIISTMGIVLDGKNWLEAKLTTPESLDLFKMIAEAVDNEMEQIVMEVSSQAFKMNRVFGLTFDVGVFLNISPDHIGPNEHPTMEDYFYCKRQLLSVSKLSIINSESDHFDLLKVQAEFYSKQVITYGLNETISDYVYKHTEESTKSFHIKGANGDTYSIEGEYSIRIPGDFNKENALCAAIISSYLDTPKESIQRGLMEAVIPGRMEHVVFNENTHVYVDFAHNYISLKSVLDFVLKEHPENDLTIILGAPGGKGLSRRKDFGELLSEYEGKVILTADDPNEENPNSISKEIASFIDGPIKVELVDDRERAIEHALEQAKTKETIVIAGKGNDDFIYINKVKQPYDGDMPIVENYIWRK